LATRSSRKKTGTDTCAMSQSWFLVQRLESFAGILWTKKLRQVRFPFQFGIVAVCYKQDHQKKRRESRTAEF